MRESTKQGNDKIARQMEAAHRTSLAKGLVGIREKKTVPTLTEFCSARLEPWAKSTFENTCVSNWLWFRAGIRRLTAHEPLGKTKLDEITNEGLAGFTAYEQKRLLNRGREAKDERRGLAVSSINSSIRVLRRVLALASEWGAIESAPSLHLLTGEHHRERVITPDEEMRYFSDASPLLKDVATVLVDTGMRPDEDYRLRWEDLNWANGCNGSLLVRHGKTKSGTSCAAIYSEGPSCIGGPLERCRKAPGRLGMASTDNQWAHRPFEPKEAAREDIQNDKREGESGRPPATHAFCPVLVSPHVSDAARTVQL